MESAVFQLPETLLRVHHYLGFHIFLGGIIEQLNRAGQLAVEADSTAPVAHPAVDNPNGAD